MGFLAILPAALNNFRDRKEDAQVNKRTLVVRFGKTFGRLEMTLLSMLPFLLGFFWLDFGHLVAGVLPMIIFPLAYLLVYLVWKTEPAPIFNQYFILCVAIHVAFGLFLSIGLNLRV
jgi:1,4-dihydroxy-2-naphthoate octaprenyltransferase